MGVNSIVKDLDNVLYIDAVPSEKTVRPPFTLFPLMEKDSDAFQESASTGSADDIGDEKRPEAFEVVFDEDYDGDLSVKICSLMAEDFQIFIDGDEYSYAVRGAKQTDPGYAMIAGPFEKGSKIVCRWGKLSAGVYMQEDIGNVEKPEKAGKEVTATASIPFIIKGAQNVLVSKTMSTVLAEVTDESVVTVSSAKRGILEFSGLTVEGEMTVEVPRGKVYDSRELKAGEECYRLVLRNAANKTDCDQCPDAFMNVTGSFAGELCYKVGNDPSEGEKGTYHTLREQNFGIDPYTGYFWGKTGNTGSSWAFGLEEGLYGISVSLGKDVSQFSITNNGKEKTYKLPEDMPRDDGPTSMTVRLRCANGIIVVRGIADDGSEHAVESIEIRTLSTTAHASDFVPAEAVAAEESEVKEPAPEETVAEKPAEEETAAEESEVKEPTAEEPAAAESEVKEPGAEESVAEEPEPIEAVSAETITEESETEEPETEETATEETSTEKTTIEESTTEETVSRENTEVSVTEESVKEEIVEAEPTEEKSVYEELTEETTVEQPAEEKSDEDHKESDADYEESDEDYEKSDEKSEEDYEEPDEDYEESEEDYEESDEDYEESEEDYEEPDGDYEESDEDYEEPDEDYEESEEDYEEPGGDYAEPDEENETVSGDDKLERLVAEALEAQQEEDLPPAEEKHRYSENRDIPLTEKVYRAAIENYFGATSHGIDFWDSERRERPGEHSVRRIKKKKSGPAGKPVTVPVSRPAEKPVTVPVSRPAEKPVTAHESRPVEKTVTVPESKPIEKSATVHENRPAEKSAAVHKPKVSVYTGSSKKRREGGLSGILSAIVKKKK